MIVDTPIDHSRDTPSLSSDDVKMADDPVLHTNGINGSHVNGDVDMKDARPLASADTSMATLEDAPSPYNSSRERPEEGEDEDQPPAKRPRILSDADKTSMTHVSTFSLSCAVTGVLIPRVPRRSSEVRHSSPSVG